MRGIRSIIPATLAVLVLGGCPLFTTDDEPSTEGPSTELEPIRPEPAHAAPAQAETAQAEPGDRRGANPHGANPHGANPHGEPADPHAQPQQPGGERIAARHILVQYRGSSRAGPDITRSKEEAQAEAERIARQARADGADFAALAREHSDGPSGPRGGDLGAFPRGMMHPAFEQAAFGLEVDGVSGVVETPFGFHVIQRYR